MNFIMIPKDAGNTEFKQTDDTGFEQTDIARRISGNKPIKWASPAKPEHARKGIQRTRQVKFLCAYAKCGNLTKACEVAGINKRTEHEWRNSTDTWYRENFKDAVQAYRDLIEGEVHQRAIDGIEVPIIGKVQTPLGPEDQIIGHKTVKSDLLLMFQAKRHIPEFKDNFTPAVRNEKPTETASPLARITVYIDMMADRNRDVIAGSAGRQNSNIIDVTPVVRELTDDAQENIRNRQVDDADELSDNIQELRKTDRS